MEAGNQSFVKKGLHREEVNLEAYRRRYNKLVLAFTLFFIFLAVITVALITYLVQSESFEESIHRNPPSIDQIDTPIVDTESEVFNLSLQKAAQELELAASLILNSSALTEAKSELALNHCREWLQIGSGQLREAIRVNPLPGRPSNQLRVEMASLIAAAEKDINSCLSELSAADSSAAVDKVWSTVIGAAAYLDDRGDFLMSYRDKMWRRFRETAGAAVEFNLVVVCLFGMQMFFIFFLFWKIIKSG